MTAITIVPENISSDWDRGAVNRDYKCAVEVEIGEAVALNSDNELILAVATSEAAARAIGLVTAVPDEFAGTTAPADGWATVCLFGPVYGFTDLDSGQPLWVSESVPGGLDDTEPTTAWTWILGNAVGENVFYVHPGQTTPVSV